jgi:hypothetical protein
LDLSPSPNPVAASELPAAETALLVATLTGWQGANGPAPAASAIVAGGGATNGTAGGTAGEEGAADPLAAIGGAFNPGMAARLTRWEQG